MTTAKASPTGDELKRRAHDLLARTRARFIRDAQRKLLEILLAVESATMDDLRAVLPVPDGINPVPDGINPVALGPVPAGLAADGVIFQAGYRKTARPIAHARPLSVWRLVDADLARQWLADHPPLPCDDDDLPTDATGQGLLFDAAAPNYGGGAA